MRRRRRTSKVMIAIPAIAFGMVMAWCMPQKALLIILSLMLMILGLLLIIKN